MFRRRTNYKKYDYGLDPDEVFLDSKNMPGFDTFQFEGRMEKPIGAKTLAGLGAFFLLVVVIFLSRTWFIQITNGEENAERSANNRLRHSLIFSDRGIIYDRNDTPLAWNEATDANTQNHDEGEDKIKDNDDNFNYRKYINEGVFSSLLGYVSYPKKDSAGFYYDTAIVGESGVEQFFNDILQKENGKRIIEIDALNNVITKNTIHPPTAGENIHLTIDAEIQKHMYDAIKQITDQSGFFGSAGVLMDVRTGEVLSMVTYPEFDSNVMTAREDTETIGGYFNDEHKPFLNRAYQGLFTPGSIFKPYVALAALQERVISPTREIVSTGSITIPNPYNPSNPSIFNDWKAHGAVNVRRALAVSSNVYFYEVGGGYKEQEGLGISRIEEYARKFGFGSEVPVDFFRGAQGTIPNPEWKLEQFDDDWRLGDTYFTAIGQYGVQVTPLQVARAVAAIATKGNLLNPKILYEENPQPDYTKIEGIEDWVWNEVHAGMRDVVLYGTAAGLNYPDIEIAGKTGTAELGVSKDNVNSWTVGFFPYKNPKYAFVILMEKGSRTNLIGGVAASRIFFDWLKVERPEMFE